MSLPDLASRPPSVMTSSGIAALAQLACLLEASAPKPGNVSPGRHFADVRYEDFLASAVAVAAPLANAASQPLGRTIRAAVEATARWAPSNTNLGIVLLLGPLARAAALLAAASIAPSLLRDQLRTVLLATTVEDARDVYAAIRRAAPGGLGRAEAQDVADEPTMTLLEVMRLAADRDGIAREYATGFETTFTHGAPALVRARRDGLSWDDAVVETFLEILALQPDTHIVRRAGSELAAQVSGHARGALQAGGVRSETGRAAIAAMDRYLRRDGTHLANPGTSADLAAAAIFVVLLDGGWPRVHGGSDDTPR
jgi:triphosphoribosyl-dephospho-CoA synthase